MARAPVVKEYVTTTDDLTTQVRNARVVVESDNRVTRVTRRDSDSSSRSNSRRRVDSLEGGRYTTSKVVTHVAPTTTVRTHESPYTHHATRTVISPGGTRRVMDDSTVHRSNVVLNDSYSHGRKTIRYGDVQDRIRDTY
jgi:hypothetical protein